MEEFWTLTPREVQLQIRAAGERRLDLYDDAVVAAWQEALWSQIGPKKMPELDRVLARRKKRRRRLTLEQDIARWEAFFARAPKREPKAS